MTFHRRTPRFSHMLTVPTRSGRSYPPPTTLAANYHRLIARETCYQGSGLCAAHGDRGDPGLSDPGELHRYLYADYLQSAAGASTGATVESRPSAWRTITGTLPTDHQFQGQQAQVTIGLDHMGARWYEPTIGL
jgi:hypothetical protein